MSGRRYSQKDLGSLRFSSLDWTPKLALVFTDVEGAFVRIPITRATATAIVRSALPELLPLDGDSAQTTATSAPSASASAASGSSTPTAPVKQGYIQLGRCDGSLFTASMTAGEATMFYRDGRRVARDELPEAVRAAAED